MLLTVIWLGLVYLRLKFGLVFFVFGGKSVRSFLLTVPPGPEIWLGLFCLRFPPSGNWVWSFFQGPLNGGVSDGGASRSGLVLPFLSFFVLLGLSRGFSRFARGLSGDFPDWSFSSFSANYQHLRGTVPKGSATQSGPFPKKVGNTRVWKPPGLASLNFWLRFPHRK